MDITLEDRMQNVEDELKQLRKEIEESVAWYKKSYKPEKCCEGGPQWGHAWDCKK